MNVKEILLKKAQENLERFFPVKTLQELGFVRKKCKICGRYFWTLDEKREICDDHKPYGFIKNPVGKKLSYIEVWKDFSKFLEKRGYVPIKRYPVVARWRDDLDFVIASIVDFQPYVVKGEVEPPAKKLTVPQFCLRFTDIQNVGYTGRHYTGFIMIGQHAFVKPEEYDINTYFKDLLDWFLHLDIPLEEFTFHEDVWAGGGNAGTSIEFFVRGLEVANQVYMQFETNGEIRELKKIKVLDMGMGQERVAWLLNGTLTSYDIVFPNVLSYLEIDYDKEFFEKVAPYLYELDFEEGEGFEKLAKELGLSVQEIKDKLEPIAARYIIADHTRSALVAIADGALPSNVGGGYNIRVILRRAYDLFEKYFGDLDFFKLFELQTKDLSLYPELKEYVDDVIEIVKYEIEKYKETKRKAQRIIKKYKGKKLSTEELIELYTSHGIRPEDLGIEPPKDFYKKLFEHREKSKVKKKKEEEIKLKKEYPSTEKVYYKNWKQKIEFAKVIGIERDFVIFDKTIFYPRGGGQDYDKGWLLPKTILKEIEELALDRQTIENVLTSFFGESGKVLSLLIEPKGISDAEESLKDIWKLRNLIEKNLIEVKEVYKVGDVIVHKVSNPEIIKEGEEYIQILNWERRLRLTRHHSAVHVLTGTLRRYYGRFVWQAGAEKTEEKARLDVTFYRLPTEEELREIEKIVNKIILEGRNVRKYWLPRNEAEQKFGFDIYQGGAVPGKMIRIVEIEGWDVEACGGTHVDNTIEIGPVKIINVERIADGIIRFELVAGDKAIEYMQELVDILKEASRIARVGYKDLPKTVEKFFNNWKEAEKRYEDLLKAYWLEVLNKINKAGDYVEIEVPDVIDLKEMMAFVNKNKEGLKGRTVIIRNKRFAVCLSEKEDCVKILKEKGYTKVIGDKKFARGIQ